MIIPALDLRGGRVVRLRQGDYGQTTVFDVNPLTAIRGAAAQGARMVHIVDLDGAASPMRRQRALIASLVKASPVPIQTGGGIRSESDIRGLLRAGVARVVVGSAAVARPELARGWLKKYGPEHFTLALDVRIKDGFAEVATHGWTKGSGLSLEAALNFFLPLGLEHVLVTDISRDGMMRGPNVGLYAALAKRHRRLDIIASGGVSELEDIRALARSGAGSAVLGRALLEGRFTVAEAVRCWRGA